MSQMKVSKKYRKVSWSVEVCDDKMIRVAKVNNVISSSLEAAASGQFEYIECNHVMTYDVMLMGHQGGGMTYDNQEW